MGRKFNDYHELPGGRGTPPPRPATQCRGAVSEITIYWSREHHLNIWRSLLLRGTKLRSPPQVGRNFMRCTYTDRRTDGRTDRKGSWEAFFNFRYGKKERGRGKMRKEKWAQHVCMRLLMVDSNMEEFAWREIYPFTDSLEIAFQPYDCLAAKVIQVCEIQNYRWL